MPVTELRKSGLEFEVATLIMNRMDRFGVTLLTCDRNAAKDVTAHIKSKIIDIVQAILLGAFVGDGDTKRVLTKNEAINLIIKGIKELD